MNNAANNIAKMLDDSSCKIHLQKSEKLFKSPNPHMCNQRSLLFDLAKHFAIIKVSTFYLTYDLRFSCGSDILRHLLVHVMIKHYGKQLATSKDYIRKFYSQICIFFASLYFKIKVSIIICAILRTSSKFSKSFYIIHYF